MSDNPTAKERADQEIEHLHKYNPPRGIFRWRLQYQIEDAEKIARASAIDELLSGLDDALVDANWLRQKAEMIRLRHAKKEAQYRPTCSACGMYIPPTCPSCPKCSMVVEKKPEPTSRYEECFPKGTGPLIGETRIREIVREEMQRRMQFFNMPADEHIKRVVESMARDKQPG